MQFPVICMWQKYGTLTQLFDSVECIVLSFFFSRTCFYPKISVIHHIMNISFKYNIFAYFLVTEMFLARENVHCHFKFTFGCISNLVCVQCALYCRSVDHVENNVHYVWMLPIEMRVCEIVSMWMNKLSESNIVKMTEWDIEVNLCNGINFQLLAHTHTHYNSLMHNAIAFWIYRTYLLYTHFFLSSFTLQLFFVCFCSIFFCSKTNVSIFFLPYR